MPDPSILFLSTPRAPGLGHRILVSTHGCSADELEDRLRGLRFEKHADGPEGVIGASREVFQAGKSGTGRMGREWLVLVTFAGISADKRSEIEAILQHFLEEKADSLISEETDWSGARNSTVVFSPALERLLTDELGVEAKPLAEAAAKGKASSKPSGESFDESMVRKEDSSVSSEEGAEDSSRGPVRKRLLIGMPIVAVFLILLVFGLNHRNTPESSIAQNPDANSEPKEAYQSLVKAARELRDKWNFDDLEPSDARTLYLTVLGLADPTINEDDSFLRLQDDNTFNIVTELTENPPDSPSWKDLHKSDEWDNFRQAIDGFKNAKSKQ